jgi:recombination protein RecA
MDTEGNIAGHKKMAAEKWWDEIGKCITQNPGSIIIVDSISALCNEAELAEGSGYQGRGALQKLEAQFCRQYADLVMPNNVTLLLLAQVQANTSGYGDPMQIKAGNSIKHASDCTVFIRTAEKWTPDSSGRILGHDMKWKIMCSPLGPPFMECNVPLRFGHGIDVVQDVINHAMNWNLIEGKGAWYNIPFDASGKFLEKAEGVKLQGEANIWAWFKANPKAVIELEKWIRNKIWPS